MVAFQSASGVQGHLGQCSDIRHPLPGNPVSLLMHTVEELIVEEMEDGGMGSLRGGVDGEDNRLFSRELAKVDLFDADQVSVFISVNLDTDGHFFELEIFKGDFSPLKKFPSVPE